MATEVKKLPNSRVKLTIIINAHEFNHGFEHELEEASKDLKVEGFRPGKAPRAQAIARIGRQRLEAGALDHAISHSYYDALKEVDLVPVEGPTVEVVDFNAPAEGAADDTKVATFTAEVDVVPEVEIKNYKKMKVKPPKKEEITEKDVEEVLNYLLKQRASLKVVEEGAVVAKDMWADISFDGKVGGVAREDMKSEHHPLVIGEGSLIPGFEDEMMGMKVGEEKTFTITFPKDYHAKELAGKKAEFTVKINELKQVVMPELDRDFAQSFGHDTVERLKEAVKANLVEERAAEHHRKLEELVIDELLKMTKFEIPQSLVKQEQERVFNDSKEQVTRMGMPWEMYLQQMGKTEEALQEEVKEQAEKNVRIGLALGKVVQEENIDDRELAMRLAVDKLIEYATGEEKK